MTDHVYKLTPDALYWLRANHQSHMDYYEDPNADFEQLLNQYCREKNTSEYRIRTQIMMKHPINLRLPDSTQPKNQADIQALEFYDNLVGMTPRLASDPCLLSYMNIFHLHQYSLNRWPQKNKNRILAHWLGSNPRDIYEYSTSGRTWWLAHISITSADNSDGEFTPESILEKFANTAEYYHRTMQFAVLRNPILRAELARTLFKDVDITVKQYRQIAIELNQEAGTRLLDVLDRQSMRDMIDRIASKIVPDNSHLMHKDQ